MAAKQSEFGDVVLSVEMLDGMRTKVRTRLVHAQGQRLELVIYWNTRSIHCRVDGSATETNVQDEYRDRSVEIAIVDGAVVLDRIYLEKTSRWAKLTTPLPE